MTTVRATIEGNLHGVPADVVAAADVAVALVEARAEQAGELAAGARTTIEAETQAVNLARIDEYADAQSDAADARASLRDVQKQQEVLRGLAELQARQALQVALPKIKERIEGLQTIAACEAAITEFSTQQISNQLRKLQEATVTERLRSAIRKELD